MNDKISDFLQETELQDRSKGTWGIGTAITRGSAKSVIAFMSVKSETDQILLSVNRELAMPIIAETLGKIGRALKDPALFDIPTATFAVLMGKPVLSWSKPCLVFVTLKPVSENSTHILLEGYVKTWGEGRPWGTRKGGFHELTRVRNEISARFR